MEGGVAAKEQAIRAMRQKRTILDNLPLSTQLSGVEGAVSTFGLDWNACLAPSFEPSETFDVLIGSDLIYHASNARPLCAAVLAHLNPDGVFYLMSQRDRAGLPVLLQLLDECGELQCEDFTLSHDHGIAPVVLSTFRPLMKSKT